MLVSHELSHSSLLHNIATTSLTDGQKIAKKLSAQISKESNAIRSLLDHYNACNTTGSHQVSLSMSDILNPSHLEGQLQSLGTWCSLAVGENREVVDSHLTLCRSNEELSMLKEDVHNCITYYRHREEVISQKIKQFSLQASPFNRGATALLHNALMENSRQLTEFVHAKEIISSLHYHSLADIDSSSEVSSSEGET